MRAKIAWSRLARNDLQEIADFIAIDSPNTATTYIELIEARCSRLADFPAPGRKYNSRYRTLVCSNHIMLYRHDKSANEIQIAAVVDGRRDYSRLFNELIAGRS
jgi:toxin ParE1/3/4